MSARALFAISDLHVGHPENRRQLERFVPERDGDWLIVCGDVGDSLDEVEWALSRLAGRFEKVLWTPGNHELHCQRDEGAELRGDFRYRKLVELCRSIGVLTPEDPYPLWEGPGGAATIAPLFLLYDYSFGSNIAPTRERALALAYEAGVVCTDEFLLHPDPYPSREQWCHARVRATAARLADRPAGVPTVLVNHFPLNEAPTRVLRHPEFAQWCGTRRTEDWHLRFDAIAVVYGHLHIPLTSWQEGVRFEEVSLGYPREWDRPHRAAPALRRILPAGGSG